MILTIAVEPWVAFLPLVGIFGTIFILMLSDGTFSKLKDKPIPPLREVMEPKKVELVERCQGCGSRNYIQCWAVYTCEYCGSRYLTNMGKLQKALKDSGTTLNQ